jgi:hypothetical protein
VVEKRLTTPELREDTRFYPEVLGHLLTKIVAACDIQRWSEVIVITDRVPVAKRRQAIEKAVKTTLAARLPLDVRYRVLHHESKSCAGLQVADYVNWAIHRKWSFGDGEPLTRVEALVRHVSQLRLEDGQHADPKK